jgi:hypothetical protein
MTHLLRKSRTHVASSEEEVYARQSLSAATIVAKEGYVMSLSMRGAFCALVSVLPAAALIRKRSRESFPVKDPRPL